MVESLEAATRGFELPPDSDDEREASIALGERPSTVLGVIDETVELVVQLKQFKEVRLAKLASVSIAQSEA